MIEVKNLSCSFSEGAFTKNKFTAVSPISAIFKNGGRYAIVGESGSGKTTLARMIAGLQRPDNGNVLIDGIAVYGRRRIAEKEHFFCQIFLRPLLGFSPLSDILCNELFVN